MSPSPSRPPRRPSSLFRGLQAELPPVAFSMLPSSILANRLDPQPRTKDDDEDEGGLDMTLNTHRRDAFPADLDRSRNVQTADRLEACAREISLGAPKSNLA